MGPRRIPSPPPRHGKETHGTSPTRVADDCLERRQSSRGSSVKAHAVDSETRRTLARQPFEEKIRKVGQLIQLSAAVKAQRVRQVDEGVIDTISSNGKSTIKRSVDSKL